MNLHIAPYIFMAFIFWISSVCYSVLSGVKTCIITNTIGLLIIEEIEQVNLCVKVRPGTKGTIVENNSISAVLIDDIFRCSINTIWSSSSLHECPLRSLRSHVETASLSVRNWQMACRTANNLVLSVRTSNGS